MGLVASALEFARDVKATPRLIRGRSYSQYAEDDILFALFDPQPEGFYVDVGAHQPKEGSNTYRLYRLGWDGLTIEPNPVVTEKFKKLRPRDTHLTMGVSDAGGELTYYEFANSVFNTFSEQQRDNLVRDGRKVTGTRVVMTAPLHMLLKQNALNRTVDVLSVDCEGFDLDVLETCDFENQRPTVILVEDFDGFHALRKGEQQSAISSFLRRKGYQPVSQALYTGLYVARDWRVLLETRKALKPRQTTLLPS